jgi:hypothetical protein
MTKEQMTKWAHEAGAQFDHMTWVERDLAPVFQRFAELVAAHEREQCAKLFPEPHKEYFGRDIQDAIRARST